MENFSLYFLFNKISEMLKYAKNMPNMPDKILYARQVSNMPDFWILAYKYATWQFCVEWYFVLLSGFLSVRKLEIPF